MTFCIDVSKEMHLKLVVANLIKAPPSLIQVDAYRSRPNAPSNQSLFHFLRFMAIAFCLSFTMAGCNSEPDTERSSTKETVFDIGEPLAPDPGIAVDTTGTSLLHLNDGIDTLDEFLARHPNAEVLTGPQMHEIILKDGSKIRGEMIDLNDAGSVILKLESGKQITIPSSDYTSIRILLNKKGGG